MLHPLGGCLPVTPREEVVELLEGGELQVEESGKDAVGEQVEGPVTLLPGHVDPGERLTVSAMSGVGEEAGEEAARAVPIRGRVPEGLAEGQVQLEQLDGDDARHQLASRRSNQFPRSARKSSRAALNSRT